MTNAQMAELNKNRKIHQIAFLVRDAEATMQKWVDNLGIGPWTVLVMDNSTCTNVIDGLENDRPFDKPFKFICAVTNVGDNQIEIIQPCYGVEIYEKWLEEHGDGLHHIKELVPNERLAETVKNYEEKGMPLTRGGHYYEDIHLYLDSIDTLGFQYEIGNCADCTIPEDKMYIFPRENGDTKSFV